MRDKSRPKRIPHIEAIVPVDGVPSRRRARDAVAGSVLRVIGGNFGSKAESARVLFDEIEARPFAAPFSRDELVVTAPLPPSATSSVRVSARGLGTSLPYKFVVNRPAVPETPPGTATLELLTAVDEQAALTARFVRLVGNLPLEDRTTIRYLDIAADGIDGARLAAQRAYEVWMQWAPLQAAESFEPLQTISLLDEVVRTSGLSDLVRRGTDAVFGGGGLIDDLIPGGIGRLISEADLGKLAEELMELLDLPALLERLREIGGWIGENVITQEGIEDILKFVKPSIEGGASVVIQGSLDAEFDLAQIISGVAGFIGLGGDTVSEAAGVSTRLDEITAKIDRLGEAIGMLEAKSDQLTTTIDEMDELAKNTNAEVFANEAKLDNLGEWLGETLVGKPWIVDDRVTRTEPAFIPEHDIKQELHDIEDAVKRLEEKGDRQEEKLDRQEEKLDRQEEKLDREEEKLDRLGSIESPQEGSIASQRGGARRVTGAVTAVRTPDDSVHIRAAVDVTRWGLAQESRWSDWVDFGRPRQAARLVTVSLDLQYEDGSNSRMTALLSARDIRGNVFHREFRGPQHSELLAPARWGRWRRFLMQP